MGDKKLFAKRDANRAGKIPFDFDKVEIGEELASFEYVLTQEMFDDFRAAAEDPDATFPTLAIKHDSESFHRKYDATGYEGTAAGNDVEFYAAPIPGKKIRVTGRIADKYIRRGMPYIAIEAVATDEDGRLLEKMRTYQMRKPDEAGKKWASQS